MPLRYRADLQTLAYMVLASALLLVQWRAEQFSFSMYVLTVCLAFAVGIMNHNHCHLPMWRARWLNRLTDCWFTLFLGHSGFVFRLCHERNDHRHRHRAQDWTRTWRCRDDNCLLGLLCHPFESAITLQPRTGNALRSVRARSTQSATSEWQVYFGRGPKPHSALSGRRSFVCWGWQWIRLQYMLLARFIGFVVFLDPLKALVFVVIPQLVTLFFCSHRMICNMHTPTSDRPVRIREPFWAG